MAFWDTPFGSQTYQADAAAAQLRNQLTRLGVDTNQISQDLLRNFATNAELRNQVLANPMQFFPEQFKRIQANLPVDPLAVARAEESDNSPVGIKGASAAGIASSDNKPDTDENPAPAPAAPLPPLFDIPGARGATLDFTGGPKVLSAQDLLDLADKYKGDPAIQQRLQEARQSISDINLEKPEFSATYGKVDPSLALFSAGAGMLASGAGVSPLTAIGKGAGAGVEQLMKDRAIAMQERQEMRQANQQFIANQLSKANALANIDLGEDRVNYQNRALAMQAGQAATQGDISAFNAATMRQEALLRASMTPQALVGQTISMRRNLDNLQGQIKAEQDPTRKAQLQAQLEQGNKDYQTWVEGTRGYAVELANQQKLTAALAAELQKDKEYQQIKQNIGLTNGYATPEQTRRLEELEAKARARVQQNFSTAGALFGGTLTDSGPNPSLLPGNPTR